jgi:hypothetical protein
VATLALKAQIPHPREGVWDVITTSLTVIGGKLQVLVEYSHAGPPSACEQRFTFLVRVEAGPRLVLERRIYEEEFCSQLSRPASCRGDGSPLGLPSRAPSRADRGRDRPPWPVATSKDRCCIGLWQVGRTSMSMALTASSA